MKKSDHELLVEIHERVVHDIPTKADLNKGKNQIIKVIRTGLKSEIDNDGPSTPERRKQIEDVREILLKAYKSGEAITLHQACLSAWTPIKRGYPTPKALYEYCHANETIF